ncbi:MAG: flavodoxin family protein [Anaerolineales bacterium]
MPKALVVYYSLEGTTQRVAEALAEATNADLLALRPRKEIPAQSLLKYPIGGFQVLTGKKPALHPPKKDPRDYDLLFIGTPVWANRYAPALRTFFAQTDLEEKAVALFCTCKGGPGRTLEDMRAELAGNRILGERAFVQPVDGEDPPPAAWAREILIQYKDSA